MSSPSDSIGNLLRQIRRLRSRWRWLTLAEGLGLALAAALGVFLGAVALDNWLHLPGLLRLGLVVAFLAGVGWLFLVRIVAPLRRPYTEEAVAVHLEGRLGDSQNRLINSVQLGRLAGERQSPILDKALEENTAAIEKGPPLERALPVKRAAQWIGALALVSLAIFAYAKYLPNYFQNAAARLTNPLGNIQPLTATTLEVTPGSTEVPMGGAAEIQVATGGEPPDKVVLQFRRGSGSRERVELSAHAPNRYSHAFLDVRQPITYSVTAGDARSERFRIHAVEGPDVAGIAIAYAYPEWTGLSPRQEKEGRGDVLAPLDSRVTLIVRANRALERAEITVPGSNPILLKQVRPDTYEWDGPIRQSGAYQLALLDTRGFKNTLPIERDFKLQPDRLPSIELKPREDIALTPDDPVALVVTAEDDFGLHEVRIVAFQSETDAPKVIATFAGNKTQRNLDQNHPLALNDLGAVGETWTLVAEATDFNPDPERKPARSQPVRVRLVATRDLVDSKLMMAAELKRGLAELIQLQQANLDVCKTIAPDFESDRLQKWSDASFATLTMKHYETAATNQVTIRAKAGELARKIEPGTFNGIRDALDNLVQREMTLAAEHLTTGLSQNELTERRERLQSSAQVQTVILDVLQSLLEQATSLETEIALQTIVEGLEKILKVEQDILARTPPNAPAPDAAGTTALADKQKEIGGWLVDLQKRLEETTARVSAEKIAAAAVFVDLSAAFKTRNIPPLMQAAETALRGQQWPQALEAETQVIDGLQSLLAMIRRELAKVAESIAASLREELKKAPVGTEAQASIHEALKAAESLAKEGATDKKSAPSKQTNVPERPIGEEMVAQEIAKYLKR
jgi:hypothetical protein